MPKGNFTFNKKKISQKLKYKSGFSKVFFLQSFFLSPKFYFWEKPVYGRWKSRSFLKMTESEFFPFGPKTQKKALKSPIKLRKNPHSNVKMLEKEKEIMQNTNWWIALKDIFLAIIKCFASLLCFYYVFISTRAHTRHSKSDCWICCCWNFLIVLLD